LKASRAFSVQREELLSTLVVKHERTHVRQIERALTGEGET